MSTRVTKLLLFDRVHVFYDMVGMNRGFETRPDRYVGEGYFIDFGKAPYNRAWKIWPPTLRRLY